MNKEREKKILDAAEAAMRILRPIGGKVMPSDDDLVSVLKQLSEVRWIQHEKLDMINDNEYGVLPV